MALVRFRGMPAQLTPFFRFSGPSGARFWRTGIAFLAVYFAVNMLTEWHEFDRPWDHAVESRQRFESALLIESVAFAPFVFLGAVLTDTFIAGVHHSIYVTVAAELSLTIVYVALASILRYKLKFT